MMFTSVRSIVMGLAAASFCAASANAAVVYQDSFSRTGILHGSAPDVVTTGGATWGAGASNGTGADFSVGTGAYVLDGSIVRQRNQAESTAAGGNNPIDAWSHLPVNAAGGPALTGLVDFTLSASVLAGTGDQYMGIGLNTAIYNGGSSFQGGQAGVYAAMGIKPANTTQTGPASVLSFGAGPSAGAHTIELVYTASAGTIDYKFDGTTRATLNSVTPANILALNYVAIYNSSFGNNATATLDNFKLEIAGGVEVPEPASMGLIGMGLLPLLARRRRSEC